MSTRLTVLRQLCNTILPGKKPEHVKDEFLKLVEELEHARGEIW